MNPDAWFAIGIAVERDYGLSGYSLWSMKPAGGGGAAEVRHTDGSIFWLAACKYGCHTGSGSGPQEAWNDCQRQHNKTVLS